MTGSRRKYKVLVADNRKNTREAVTEIFTQAGYAVSSASSGSETIEQLTKEAYDLIFCDLDMPRKSGLEIIRMVRALNQRAKIVVTSSGGVTSVRSRMKKEGAFEILDKPLRKATILSVAREALGEKEGAGAQKGGLMNGNGLRRGIWKGVSPEEWSDWRWQSRNLLRSVDDLARILPLDARERKEIEAVVPAYRLSITPYYASLMDPSDPQDPIRRQAVPSSDEKLFHGHEIADPLAEEETSPVPGLTHRYPDRVLLVTTSYCYMYCRHCTRKRIWSQGEAPATRRSLDAMIGYIRRHPEIRDALVSGGDPLTLPPDRLDSILSRLRAIPHLEIIRVGTRVPVVMPMRVTSELVDLLQRHSPLWLNTQFNHPAEVTPEAAAAVEKLLRAGIPVNNQSVLLEGVNNRPGTMLDLNQALLRAKVRPYYLFQCDPVLGAEHFRTPLETGLEIMESLRGHTSGLAIPSYVVDLPGGGGKVPITPNYIVDRTAEGIVLRNYEGRIFTYPNPPARTARLPRPLEALAPISV